MLCILDGWLVLPLHRSRHSLLQNPDSALKCPGFICPCITSSACLCPFSVSLRRLTVTKYLEIHCRSHLMKAFPTGLAGSTTSPWFWCSPTAVSTLSSTPPSTASSNTASDVWYRNGIERCLNLSKWLLCPCGPETGEKLPAPFSALD